MKYIPLFDTGFDLNREIIPSIIDELRRLKEYFLGRYTDLDPHLVARRFDFIIAALEQALTEFDEIAEIYA